MCPHRSETFKQGCLQGGQPPEWQICLVRLSWWQSGGFLLNAVQINSLRSIN
jgi:hypothetical protein